MQIVSQQRKISIPPARLDKVADDGEFRVVSEGDDLFVDHKSKDSHHGGTSIVQFDGMLGKLGLLIKVIPSKVTAISRTPMKAINWTKPAVGMELGPNKAAIPLG